MVPPFIYDLKKNVYYIDLGKKPTPVNKCGYEISLKRLSQCSLMAVSSKSFMLIFIAYTLYIIRMYILYEDNTHPEK